MTHQVLHSLNGSTLVPFLHQETGFHPLCWFTSSKSMSTAKQLVIKALCGEGGRDNYQSILKEFENLQVPAWNSRKLWEASGMLPSSSPVEAITICEASLQKELQYYLIIASFCDTCTGAVCREHTNFKPWRHHRQSKSKTDFILR